MFMTRDVFQPDKRTAHAFVPPRADRSPGRIDSKFLPPRLSSRLLAVPRLELRFKSAGTKRVRSVIAPGGYGKTTMLVKQRTYAQACGIKTAWVNLDSADNDCLLFLYQVISALHQAMPDLGAELLMQIRSGAASSPGAVLQSLCHALGQVEDELMLFLDDYHVIESESVHQAMNWLIACCPRSLKFIFGSRERLPLKLSKLRLSEDIDECYARDLCLQANEVASFVSLVSGISLNERQVAALHQRTEGWIAGLQLASLALQQTPDIDRFINDFSGNDQDVSSYLSEIVLDRLPGDVRDFLMRTALFDRFSAAFYDALWGGSQAVYLIERVRERNLFLEPVDLRQQWFRYHPLFADYLRERFIVANRDKLPAIRRAASAWFAAQGERCQAINYAVAGQEDAAIVDLVANYAVRGLKDALVVPSAGAVDQADTLATATSGSILSARETQILKLVDSGLNNRDLAARLFVSEGTIKWHLHNIYVKLDAANRTGAIAKARALGLI